MALGAIYSPIEMKSTRMVASLLSYTWSISAPRCTLGFVLTGGAPDLAG